MDTFLIVAVLTLNYGCVLYRRTLIHRSLYRVEAVIAYHCDGLTFREAERENRRETLEADDKKDSVQCLNHLAYCEPVCSIGLSFNGLSLYINATLANLGYSKFMKHS